MQLGPDRLSQILCGVFIAGGGSSSGTDRRRVAFNQVSPGCGVAMLTRDRQAEIAGLNLIYELNN